MMDQTAINAGFDFRRYAMNPTPAKPRIIIAQVAGSGTALTPWSENAILKVGAGFPPTMSVPMRSQSGSRN